MFRSKLRTCFMGLLTVWVMSHPVWAGLIDPEEYARRLSMIDSILSGRGSYSLAFPKFLMISKIGGCGYGTSPFSSLSSLYSGLEEIDLGIRAGDKRKDDSIYNNVRVLTEEKLVKEINAPDGETKLEVGAARKPLCDGNNTVFSDVVEVTLNATRELFKDKSPAPEFIVAPASRMPQLHDSVTRIVAKNLPLG
jgi:hypothetical protein